MTRAPDLRCRRRPGQARGLRGDAMSTVMVHAVVSVDGFIADRNDEVGPLFDWYFNGDVPIGNSPGAPAIKVSSASGEYVNGMWASIETTVMGRPLFDLTNGWE